MFSRAMVLAAAGLLVLGFFAPIVQLPVRGAISYFEDGMGDGAVILLMALASVWLAARGPMRGLLWTGLICAAVFAFTLLRLLRQVSEIRMRVTHGLDGAFDGLADRAAQPMVPLWGSAVIALAIVLILAAGWMGRRER